MAAAAKKRQTIRPEVNRRRLDDDHAAAFINKLGDDVLIEILIRSFPNPKPASRSKAVCKRWSSLISSPSFNRRFLSHHQTISERQPPLLIPSDDSRSTVRSFLSVPHVARSYFVVLDSFKDLLLCGVSDPGADINNELARTYFVCNPFTKEWIALPLAPEMSTTEEVEYRSRVATLLVCDPRVSTNLDLGDDDQVFVYSEYRFRVVCVYQTTMFIKLDVFCSESGEWIDGALVLDDGHWIDEEDNVVSCNGELFWQDFDGQTERYSVAVFNPFHLDTPPAFIDYSPSFLVEKRWLFISVSQGEMHLMVFKQLFEAHNSPRIVSSVWRLEGDRKTWKKLCEGSFKATFRSRRAHDPCNIVHSCLHPEKPNIVFFMYDDEAAIWSYDLSTTEEEIVPLRFVDKLSWRRHLSSWTLFQPKLSLWATPIPRYEKLRTAYNGSYDFFHRCNARQQQIPPLYRRRNYQELIYK